MLLEDTTCYDRCRYHVGMLWADEGSSLRNKYFSALVHLKSLERRLDRNQDLKTSFTQMITGDLEKAYIVDKKDFLKNDCPSEW